MKLADLQVVLKIAELQSITSAANLLNISTSSASMALKRIEQALGSQLFVRTTRNLRTTVEGETLLPFCQQALALIQEGLHLIDKEQNQINGELKIAMSSEMGRNLMRTLLNTFIEQYPQIVLRLHVTDAVSDFYRDGVDVALRAMTKSTAQESNLFGIKICNIPHLICAAPSYIAKHGKPNTPHEITQHNTLLYKLYESINDCWDFYQGNEQYKIKVKSNRAVNDGDIVRRWCVDGVGIAKKSAIDIADDLLHTRVVRLMENYQIPMTEMWLTVPSKQMITPTVRLLANEIKITVNKIREALINKSILTADEWPK